MKYKLITLTAALRKTIMKIAKFLRYLTACCAIAAMSSSIYAQDSQKQNSDQAQEQKSQPERIVSLGGDVTEIIYALNAEQNLVGRDSTSLHPKAKSLPDVGYMRQLNVEGILALKPTRIITTEVAQPTVVLKQLEATGVKVDTVPLKYSPESVVEKIKQIGELLGKEDQAVKLAENFAAQIKAIPSSPLDVKILFILNRAGANNMVAGTDTVADSAIRLVGAKNAMGNLARFTPISQEGIIAANPDVVVLTNLGLKQLGSLDKLWTLAGMQHTNAAKHQNVVIVDDIAFLAFGLTIPAELQKIRQAAEKALATR